MIKQNKKRGERKKHKKIMVKAQRNGKCKLASQ